MEDRKSFFENLEPKSALIVGMVGGVLVLCTIGFIVTLFILLGGKSGVSTNTVATINNNPAAQPSNTPPPTVVKADRPKVELFVMSYCPYGLQMQKAYIPAMQLLKNKADIDIKFVSYAMHGLKEVEENTRQYCIQTEQNDKFANYLKCFSGSGDFTSCLSQAGVNTGKVNSCVTATNKKFAIMDKYNDQSSWLSGQFPLYPIYQDLNQQYGVQGSPTLVINGAQVNVNRTPEAIKQAICASFNDAPSECDNVLDSSQPEPGFGNGVAAASGGAAPVQCET
ncbi:MAG: hypothetical protein Q7S66_02215 [bacterium]|nr:hypothetical protein [bacterium]